MSDQAAEAAPEEATAAPEEALQEGFEFDDGIDEAPAAEAEKPAEEAAEQPETPPKEEKTPESKAKIDFTPEQQEVFNAEIGKKVGKIHAAEQEAKKLREELEQTKAQLPQDQRPAVPAIPDSYDPDYESKLAARDKAIADAATFDYNERIASEQALQQQQQAMEEQNKQAAETIKNFQKNATDLGITIDEVRDNFQTLGQYGIPNSAVAYMIDEPLGPQIGRYLANNPVEVDALKGLSPQQVAVRIAIEIKPKAQGSAPKVDVPPAPADTLRGNGAKEAERGPAGTMYE